VASHLLRGYVRDLRRRIAMTKTTVRNGLLITICCLLSACQTIYYNFWEMLGQEKRDLLQSNVAKVQDDQNDVQEAFQDALERVRQEYKLDAKDLEDFYDDLRGNYEKAQAEAETLKNRIEKVRTIA